MALAANILVDKIVYLSMPNSFNVRTNTPAEPHNIPAITGKIKTIFFISNLPVILTDFFYFLFQISIIFLHEERKSF